MMIIQLSTRYHGRTGTDSVVIASLNNLTSYNLEQANVFVPVQPEIGICVCARGKSRRVRRKTQRERRRHTQAFACSVG
jgi:hypothetical protein